MRRSYRSGQSGSTSASVSRLRSDYLFLLKNLQNHDELFSRSLGLLGAIASEEEVMQLCADHAFQPAAQTEVRANCLSDRSELFDRLAYFLPQKFGSTERAKLKLGRNLVSILSRNISAKLSWQENTFLRYLRDNLGLSDQELKLLWVLYLQQSSRELDFLNVGIADLSEELLVLQACLGAEGLMLGELLLRDSKLIATGLIESNGDIPKISPRVVLAIGGQISLSAFQAENFQKDQNPVYNLGSFDFNPVDVQIILSLLKGRGPAHILLYGKPGGGKTEAARSLIRAAGLEVINIPVHATGGRHSRLTRVRYADHFSNRCGIIVDEAELILNNAVRFIAYESDSTPTKAVLNTYLDSSTSKIIWILNDTDYLHESTLRRFHFKLYFDKLSRRQRTHALDLIVSKHNIESLVTPEIKKRILAEEHLNPGIFDRIAYGLVQAKSTDTEILNEAIIDRMLFSNRPQQAKPKEEVLGDPKHDIDALNISMPVSEILQIVGNFLAAPKRHRNGLNLLFWGLPGSGKTEFARHLALRFNRDLVIKRGSDLLGMYVGSTEQSIAVAFREVQGNESILLIDEADTFFRSRENARQAYEVSHTNEFLNQLENHNGIVVCCTNAFDALDSAIVRRFPLKVEFMPVKRERLSGLFMQMLKEVTDDVPQIEMLERALGEIEGATPGDFSSVLRRMQLRNAPVPWSELVKELAQEIKLRVRYSPRSIGFQ
ncbi:MAG: ATP-binding protein [Turneriella sp.]|nr:ATP-binding protein [Turneriella sp.]